jgi:hypothetical protein
MVSLYILGTAYPVHKGSVQTSQRILGYLSGKNRNLRVCVNVKFSLSNHAVNTSFMHYNSKLIVLKTNNILHNIY